MEPDLPLAGLPGPLVARAARLAGILRGLRSVAVATSGGVDSALLLAVAVRVLGDRAVGVIARSPSLPEDELEDARALARRLGASLIEIETDEMARPGYIENSPERCYHCKAELFERVRAEAERRGLRFVVHGANADDRRDRRPGTRAAQERDARAPLDEAGLGKEDVRALARALGLPIWDKPAAACLASRIPYGETVTVAKLSAIERAERAVRALGFRVFRVRHHGRLARIEIAPEEMGRLLDPEVRTSVADVVRGAGFTWIALDLDGYRMGSLNEVLAPPVGAPVGAQVGDQETPPG